MGIKITADTFPAICVQAGLPKPMPEHVFAPPRKWRFDWLFTKDKDRGESDCFALEIEGGIWTKGRHTRGKGFLGDMEKYNEAAVMGIFVLRCTPQEFESGKVLTLLKRAMT